MKLNTRLFEQKLQRLLVKDFIVCRKNLQAAALTAVVPHRRQHGLACELRGRVLRIQLMNRRAIQLVFRQSVARVVLYRRQRRIGIFKLRPVQDDFRGGPCLNVNEQPIGGLEQRQA